MSAINPKDFAEKYLTNFNLKDLAQVGADIRLSKLWLVSTSGISKVSGSDRQFAERNLIEPVDGEYHLHPGRFYEWVSDVRIKVPANAAGIIIARSSMLRAGVFVTSGVWDPSYEGTLGGFMSVQGGPVALAADERVGQLVMFEASACNQYSGAYMGSASTVDFQEKNK